MSRDIVRRDTDANLLRREVGDAVTEYLAFYLDEIHYALPLSSVREILKVTPITEVPRARAEILGIISVRGRITTVMDLRARLGKPRIPPGRRARILLVQAKTEEVIGLMVDDVDAVYRFHTEDVEPAHTVASDLSDPVFGLGRSARTRGTRRDASLTTDPDEILILLDPVAVLEG